MAQRWLPELMPRITHDDGNLVADATARSDTTAKLAFNC